MQASRLQSAGILLANSTMDAQASIVDGLKVRGETEGNDARIGALSEVLARHHRTAICSSIHNKALS
jgi:hypothetical protein